MQVVLNVKGSFRTTGGGHNREVVALYSTGSTGIGSLEYTYICTCIIQLSFLVYEGNPSASLTSFDHQSSVQGT